MAVVLPVARGGVADVLEGQRLRPGEERLVAAHLRQSAPSLRAETTRGRVTPDAAAGRASGTYSSITTWQLVPLMPNELIPARRTPCSGCQGASQSFA